MRGDKRGRWGVAEMVLVRIVHFLIGAVLAGGGGYLAWTLRNQVRSIFPPPEGGVPWLLVLGVLGVVAGLVFLVSAVAPRPNRKARLAAEAERRKETIRAADTYYAERARAADRDWRSGDLPPPSTAPQPPLAKEAPPQPARTPVSDAAPKPAAPASSSNGASPSPFPASATLAPIPKSAEPPPPSTPAPSNVVSLGAGSSFAAIRSAIADGRLDDADRMLNAEREGAQGEALAELTGLAGDHAAAAGRQSNAKWLWRLALKRFGEANAMNSPAARAVSERLRLADN
jgi:hypothetical protein